MSCWFTVKTDSGGSLPPAIAPYFSSPVSFFSIFFALSPTNVYKTVEKL
jgi:hypothetical protein